MNLKSSSFVALATGPVLSSHLWRRLPAPSADSTGTEHFRHLALLQELWIGESPGPAWAKGTPQGVGFQLSFGDGINVSRRGKRKYQVW